jgi:hypothetical protein
MRQNIMAAGACGIGCLLHGRQQAEREEGVLGIRYHPQGHIPTELLPSARPHLLNFLEPPKIAPPVWDQEFIT